MIRWETDTVELQGPLGRLGSIRALDLWQARESVEQCKELVATIASLSYGNEAAKNPEALFDSIVNRGHLSCLEFVPECDCTYDSGEHLPVQSLRGCGVEYLGHQGFTRAKNYFPATAFLVEAPIFVARQWMRHRAFSYLEMSRRYVKDSKVPFEFYGEDDIGIKFFNTAATQLYSLMVSNGEKPEVARRVIPVGAITRFWVGGFDRDWLGAGTKEAPGFCGLRCDPHAQEEIRIFANWIRDFLEAKESK